MTNSAPRIALGLRTWADAIGTEKTRAVLAAAEVNIVYFNAMANYTKSCTPAMFERIERAAIDLGITTLPDYEACTRKSLRASARAAKAAAKTAQKDVEQQIIADFKTRQEALRA
jgi:hypothetical protein